MQISQCFQQLANQTTQNSPNLVLQCFSSYLGQLSYQHRQFFMFYNTLPISVFTYFIKPALNLSQMLNPILSLLNIKMRDQSLILSENVLNQEQVRLEQISTLLRPLNYKQHSSNYILLNLIISDLININLMSKFDDKKYLHYSLAFYQKEKDLLNISMRAKLGFDQLTSPSKESSLKPKTVENFLKFNSKNKEDQKELLQQDPEAFIEALLDVIICLNRETSLMEYVLTTVDAIFTEERQILRIVVQDLKKGKYPNLISKLKGLETLNAKSGLVHPLIILAAYRVISILLGELPVEQFFHEQRIFLFELIQKKRTQKEIISDYGFVSCLVHLNKHNVLASLFLDNDGGSLLLQSLHRCGNDIQLIYYSLMNVWMISFLQSGVEKYIGVPKMGVIKAVCDILQKVSRQKITRVAFMIFKNIQENNVCLQLMIDNRLLKIIDTILKGNIKDEQLINSIKDIGIILESSIRVLSSFEKYVKEIKSHSLQWSSVHNERFWKQNALKFENNEYEMIKQLKFLLGSKRALNVAIACYDIGEFCRFYPRGKAVIETFQIKELIMEKARYSEDKSVREQGLIALQKIMIQNWQAI